MDINDGFNDALGDGLNDAQNHQNAADNNNGEYSYNSYKSYKPGDDHEHTLLALSLIHI